MFRAALQCDPLATKVQQTWSSCAYHFRFNRLYHVCHFVTAFRYGLLVFRCAGDFPASVKKDGGRSSVGLWRSPLFTTVNTVVCASTRAVRSYWYSLTTRVALLYLTHADGQCRAGGTQCKPFTAPLKVCDAAAQQKQVHLRSQDDHWRAAVVAER